MPNPNRTATRRPLVTATLVFLISAVIASAVIWHFEKARIKYERARISDLAGEHTHAIQLDVESALSAAVTLATLVQMGKGEVPEFDTAAALMLSFYPAVSALQLAPDGVIARIMPLKGNEKALGHNLLRDPERDKEAFLARDTGRLTLAGPFQLVQGGMGAAGRMPVYLDDGKGNVRFWGFTIVLIRFPDILATARLARLVAAGYDYKLWRTHPDTGQKHVFAVSSDAPLAEPVERTLQVPNATWTLSVAPAKGWVDLGSLALKCALGLLFSLLSTYLWSNYSWRRFWR